VTSGIEVVGLPYSSRRRRDFGAGPAERPRAPVAPVVARFLGPMVRARQAR